ncbi:MAG TPA: septation protein SpoVG family protein [Candidatus Omnitrophota bacterium]|nr:septation protein SpoVG family protein [Candidatus Omnitrophota bacterium]
MGVMEINIDRIYRRDSDAGKIRAYVDISIGDYGIKGFKLIEGKHGLFVQVPTRPATNSDKVYNIFYPKTREAREILEQIIINAYNQS